MNLGTQAKEQIFRLAKQHIESVSTHISSYTDYIQSSIERLRETLRTGNPDDPEILQALIVERTETKKQLTFLKNTPYFVRCEVEFEGENIQRSLYFGRFSFINDDIYSWVAPAAAIRFEDPGRFSYVLPSGNERKGILLRKDQYLIVDKKILFLSTEATTYARELIYQEYFSKQKTGFVLPEIVEQMEKAQDSIIRSNYFGSFLISGPAGSGKTTLALHRVAYLMQSPETEKLFQPENVIVFVQDQATKSYFSSLLPELGIFRVKIITFDEWAITILGLKSIKFVNRYGKTENEKDLYEFAKHSALLKFKKNNGKSVKNVLLGVYKDFLSKEQFDMLIHQLQHNLLDRFDLTILLAHNLSHNTYLTDLSEKYVLQRNGRYSKKLVKKSIQYSLIVLDEAENYLEEQIIVLKSCISPKTDAMIYVGDLVQQTLLWTIKDWQRVNEHFAPERSVKLTKVYRNTKQILEYIKSMGYPIDIPDNGLRKGNPVSELVWQKSHEELEYVQKIVSNRDKKTIGILTRTNNYLDKYKKVFINHKNVFVMTINEAQGVEFDIVCLIGVNKDLFVSNLLVDQIAQERRRVDHDLLYVALTRAIYELHVLGDSKLQDVL